MELILVLLVLVALGAVAVGASQRTKQRELTRREDELAPVRKLAFEDITAFGEDLQQLDLEMSGHELDAGATSDYQRALDAYESAKVAGDSIDQPEDIRHISEIVEAGRYAVACVRARVSSWLYGTAVTFSGSGGGRAGRGSATWHEVLALD